MAKDGRIALTAALAAWALCVQPAAAGTAMVFDFEDGHVLYAEDLDTPWYPASLTKMMTAYLVFTAIRDKRATKDTKVFISPTANKQPPTRLGLKVGKDVTLSQALQALIMRSANDVAVAIAETLGGDEAAFVKQMNQTAARLGMAHTHFINPHGLPAEQQVTTARDMGLLAQALLRDFPEEASLYAQDAGDDPQDHHRHAQCAADIVPRRRRHQDRLHLRFRLQPRRQCHAQRPQAHRGDPRRDEQQRAHGTGGGAAWKAAFVRASGSPLFPSPASRTIRAKWSAPASSPMLR